MLDVEDPGRQGDAGQRIHVDLGDHVAHLVDLGRGRVGDNQPADGQGELNVIRAARFLALATTSPGRRKQLL